MEIINNLIITVIPYLPKFFIKIIANKYIAGTNINHAINTVKKINSIGQLATLDILGEHTKDKDSCHKITNEYIDILNHIYKNKLNCNISIKPSHIGSDISKEQVLTNFIRIQNHATELNNFIRLDMENSNLTKLTLDLHNNLSINKKNIGLVIQAYLHRSKNDIENLNKNTNIRLCKGIYNENSKIAIKDPKKINENYLKLLEIALDRNIYVGIATHDKSLINQCIRLIKKKNISINNFEFQYLYGVPLNDMIRIYNKNNFNIRAYVPYGLDWYDYSIRRIKENPKIATYVIKNLFK